MTQGKSSKFVVYRDVVYRDVGDGYRWRLQTSTGETLAAASLGHQDKHSCYQEIRAVMADHPAAEILDVAVD